jgi:hypothetical protein
MMIIHIIGGICSGKTSVIEKLREEFPDILTLMIDEERMVDISKSEETIFRKIESSQSDVIVMETSGLNYLVNKYLDNKNVVTIKLIVNHDELKKRVLKRQTDENYQRKYFWGNKDFEDIVNFNDSVYHHTQSDVEIDTSFNSEEEIYYMIKNIIVNKKQCKTNL